MKWGEGLLDPSVAVENALAGGVRNRSVRAALLHTALTEPLSPASSDGDRASADEFKKSTMNPIRSGAAG
jgi:hypothetical protein